LAERFAVRGGTGRQQSTREPRSIHRRSAAPVPFPFPSAPAWPGCGMVFRRCRCSLRGEQKWRA
jgi:hypothetical protein